MTMSVEGGSGDGREGSYADLAVPADGADARLDSLEAAMALVREQAAELRRLRLLSARLAQLERAKGILMERHSLRERDAHERMRRHARSLNVKLSDVAEAVLASYLLVRSEDE
jgi:AmiR/NasT family two-component response regulator